MDHSVYNRIKWCAERQTQSERMANLVSYMASPNSNLPRKQENKMLSEKVTWIQELKKKKKSEKSSD